MYQLIVKIGLILTMIWNICFGANAPIRQQEVKENGSLAAVDELGRKVITAGKSEKQVGVFYFLWAGEHGTDGPYDITEITKKDPQAYLSAERWEAAGGGGYGAFHHWGEPLFGYYLQSDRWVISRHCQMLTDAGVDFIVFDATNGFSYLDRAKDLIDVWYGYLEDGWKVPQLAFYTNSASGKTINAIYDGLYNNAELKATYPRLDELWYRMNGKPMIIGWQDDPELREDARGFFRIKTTQWPNSDKETDGFPWMEFGRLGTFDAYYKNSPADKSIMNISVAQHCATIRFSSSAWYGGNDHGRSWHNGAKDTAPDALKYGYNFAEQWEYALKLDPDIIFVTGFNEWIAQRYQFVDSEPVGFCDNCTEEYSRDVEPAAGVLGDNYYMQMVQYIAKFKRSAAVLPESPLVSIDVNGSFAQWDNPSVRAVYRDYRNDTFNRASRGYGDLYYADDSGRNDIVRAKVAEDSRYLYYYVETASPLSPATEVAWMTLFLNVKGEKAGYDFCVNRTAPMGGKTAVEAVTDAGYETVGSAEIRFEDNKLMLRVPKATLGLAGNKKAAFTFKWADNYEDGNLLSFYTRGDSAPYGRLNWVYGGNG